MDTEKLKAILAAHAAWLRGEGGEQANLYGADMRGVDLSGVDLSGAVLRESVLTGASLSGADLIGADLIGAVLREAVLRGARLSEASLSEATGLAWASVGWSGHGECGRVLLAVADQDGPGKHIYHCGCFRGSLDQLREYIAGGEEQYRASRTECADIVSRLLAMAIEARK